MSGELDSVTDGNNRTTQYTYDQNNGLLKSVSLGSGLVNYGYTGDRLETITTGTGQVYDLLYDSFHRSDGVMIGSGENAWQLSDMEYNARGLLSKQTYGNGAYIEFDFIKKQVNAGRFDSRRLLFIRKIKETGALSRFN